MASDNMAAAIAGGAGAIQDLLGKYIEAKFRAGINTDEFKQQRDYLAQEDQTKFQRESYLQPNDIPEQMRTKYGISQPIRKEVFSAMQPTTMYNINTGQLTETPHGTKAIAPPVVDVPLIDPETGEQKGTTKKGAIKLGTEKTQGMNPYQTMRTSSDLRKEFIGRQEVKDYVNVNTQVKSMRAILNNPLANKVATDQALVTMFNKLTDPQSVVRESEYARTPENLPIVNRISGAIEKVKQGGAGLTDDDRKALVQGAKIIMEERAKTFNETRTNYIGLARNSNVNPDLVVGAYGEHKPEVPQVSTPTVTPNKKVIKFDASGNIIQ